VLSFYIAMYVARTCSHYRGGSRIEVMSRPYMVISEDLLPLEDAEGGLKLQFTRHFRLLHLKKHPTDLQYSDAATECALSLAPGVRVRVPIVPRLLGCYGDSTYSTHIQWRCHGSSEVTSNYVRVC